jgi:hypothetical protein
MWHARGRGRGVYSVLGGRPEGKSSWEDNIKADLREIGIGSLGKLDSAGSGKSPMANLCEHDNEPSGSIKKAGYSLTS